MPAVVTTGGGRGAASRRPAAGSGRPGRGGARRRRACAALIAMAALLACARDRELPTGPIEACDAVAWDAAPRPRNVILVVNDTMRRDRAGVYGGFARTPGFDAVAGQGFYLTRAVAQAPWTKPSIATLFTGLYPSQHGALTHPMIPAEDTGQRRSQAIETDVLADRLVTLAERLHGAGYRTAGFVANPWLQARFGFAQGFDEYVLVPGEVDPREGSLLGVVDPALAHAAHGEAVSRAGVEWLARRQGGQPYFLYLHYMDSHGPYPALDAEDLARGRARIASDRRALSEPASAALEGWRRLRVAELPSEPVLGSAEAPLRLAHLELAYEKGIERFDRALVSLLAALDAQPDAADTAVLVTSDHGEAFFERGWGEHGYDLFDEVLGVPFAARMPGVTTHGAVACPFGLIDVTATLCAYLGVDCPQPDFGVSLLSPPPPAPARSRRYLVSEAVIGRPRNRAIRNAYYKLLWEPQGRPRALEPAPPSALFAIEDDPLEQHDLIARPRPSRPARIAFDTLSAQVGIAVPPFAAPQERAPLDEATRARLEALGYLKETAPPAGSSGRPAP